MRGECASNVEDRSRPAAPPAWTSNDAARARVSALAILALALCGLGLHAARFHPFFADDALISLRYAKRLLQGLGLSWTDGAPVEGYSNLLWILLTAALGALGVELVTAARVLGLACTAVALGALVWRYRGSTLVASIPAIAGAATLVLAAPIAVWAIGGLEQPLVAAGLAVAVAALLPHLGELAPPRRNAWIASLSLAVICWTRPDAPLFTAIVCGMWVVLAGFRAASFRAAARLALLPIVFVLAQLAFRLVYYGDFVPNTARAKISPSWPHFVHGAGYLWRGFLSLSPVSELASLAALLAFAPFVRADASHRRRVAFLGALALAWSAYLVAVSGDIFPAFRHFVPLLVLLGFLVAETSRFWIDRTRGSRGLGLVLLLCAASFPLYLAGQWSHFQTRRALAERFEWEGQVVGLALKRGFGDQQPLLAVTSAGTVPYWSELPALDMLGLNDRYLAHNPPESFGKGNLGHELGDADYVLGRKPDLLLYHIGLLRSRLRAGQELHARPEFHAHYTAVRFVGHEPTTQRFDAWVRRDSEKIGIRREGERIVVPGYLFNGNATTVAALDAEGRFVVPVTQAEPAALFGLTLASGRWRLSADASWKTTFGMRGSGSDPVSVRRLAPDMFEVSGPDPVTVDVQVLAAPLTRAELRSVTLTRLGS